MLFDLKQTPAIGNRFGLVFGHIEKPQRDGGLGEGT